MSGPYPDAFLRNPLNKHLDNEKITFASDFDHWSNTIQVTQVEEYHVKLNNLPMDMVDWHYVSDDCGIRAYFPSETDACFFRLALVNTKLNKI